MGREREAARLQAFLQEVQAGKGQVVDIVGEPGMGKSRLIEHVHQQFVRDGVTFVHVFCPLVRVGLPGEPIRDVLRQCCGLTPTDGRDTASERLTWWLSQLDIEPDEVMPYLLHVLAYPEADDRRLTQQPALLKVQMLMALRRIFVAHSQRQPLVLAVEDIQWLDQTSADCLSVLTRDISDLPVLLILTRRPDASPLWYERGEVTSLALDPLADADRLRLLEAVCTAHEVAPRVDLATLTRGEGHPGFLTQLARWCVDMGAHDDPMRLTTALPSSLTEVVAARLACAPQPTRQLLQPASVLGPVARVPVLEQLWEGELALEAVLQEAVSAGFYHPLNHAVDGIYRISQADLQSGIYHDLPSEQRQHLHTAVAEALERIYAGRLEQVSDLLAWHYAQAGRPEDALPHWGEAAHRAANWGDYADAIALSEQRLAAIACLSKRKQKRLRLACLLDKARWLTALGQCRESVELLQTEHETFSATKDARLRAQYALALSHAYSQEGTWDQAVASAQQAIEDATDGQDGATAGQAYAILAMERYRIGRSDEGALYSRQAIGLLEQPETETQRALAYFVLGLNCIVLGQFHEALAAESETEQIGAALADPQLQASAAWATGWALAARGDWPAAVVVCQRALAAGLDLLTVAFSLGVLGYIHIEQEKPQEAVPHLEQAIRTMQQCGYKRMQGLYTTYLGIAYLQQGHLDRAQRLAEESREIASATADRFSMGWSLRLLGHVAQRGGRLDDAREHLERAMRTFLLIRASFEVARTQLHLAEVACEQGVYHAASIHALEAYRRFTKLQVPVYIERVAEFNRRSFCPRPFSSFVFFPLFRFRFRPISRLPTWSIPPNPA